MPKTVAFAVTLCLLGIVMAKNLTLTAEKAATFWSVFEQCEKEQNVIMDEQLEDIQRYADYYQRMDDATAIASRIPLVH